jgi:serine-type D-Ala-D-Ala endopeptidase (penicillin-binding protein 7)
MAGILFAATGDSSFRAAPARRAGATGPASRLGRDLSATRRAGRNSRLSSPGAPHGTEAHSSAQRLEVKSNAALVVDETQGETLFSKNPLQIAPIASITKLMTAMVVLDEQLPMEQILAIDRADVDGVKKTASRLKVGMRLQRGDLLWVALMASENRAAAALARTFPGGTEACVAAMNRKARELGMLDTRFQDASGLSSENVSTATDLARMVRAAYGYPAIRESTTSAVHWVTLADGRVMEYHNSNGLVKNPAWSIGLSKTGYINEAGRCLVMRARIAARPVIIVLLDSWGKYTRLGDANRIRKWMEATLPSISPTG